MGTILTHPKPCIPACRTIGVCGTASNVGATHLSIALANFLCSKFYSNTAYLEMNGSHEILALAGKKNSDTPFVHQRVTYYPGVTLVQTPKILSCRYKYFVMDFGCPNSHTIREFLQCDLRLIVGYVSPWKVVQLEQFVRKLSGVSQFKEEENVYIGNFMGRKKDLEQISKKLNIRMIPMPFLPNPFRVTSSDFGFFETIFRKEI